MCTWSVHKTIQVLFRISLPLISANPCSVNNLFSKCWNIEDDTKNIKTILPCVSCKVDKVMCCLYPALVSEGCLSAMFFLEDFHIKDLWGFGPRGRRVDKSEGEVGSFVVDKSKAGVCEETEEEVHLVLVKIVVVLMWYGEKWFVR
jgi:hypothetical protein